jgi:hypothetical protein
VPLLPAARHRLGVEQMRDGLQSHPLGVRIQDRRDCLLLFGVVSQSGRVEGVGLLPDRTACVIRRPLA